MQPDSNNHRNILPPPPHASLDTLRPWFLLSTNLSRLVFYNIACHLPALPATAMALDTFFHNKIESMKLEIVQGTAKLRRLEAQRNDYNSRVRLLREELGLLQQPGSYVGEVVKVMSTKKVLVKVHPEGKYGAHHGHFHG
jgi:hypothetical protein